MYFLRNNFVHGFRRCVNVAVAVTALLALPVSTALAQDGRITGAADPARRCGGTPVPPDVCTAKQKKALDSGCVTPGEYNALVRYGSFPTCDYDETPPAFYGWCACGCFDQSVKLMSRAKDGALTWNTAGDVVTRFHEYRLASLAPASTLSAPNYVESAIRLATRGAEAQPLYVIGTKYGKGLRLTSAHAVLLASGKMVTTQTLTVGDELVGIYGEPVRIESIERAMATGDVVNFATEQDNHLAHILGAEGVLVGDLLWQSSYADELNAVILRR